MNTNSKKGIYLTGGWGYGNRGDNAIFEGMLQTFKANNAFENLYLTSFSQKETFENHGLHSVPSLHKLLKRRNPASWPRWAAVWIWRLTGRTIMLSSALRSHITALRGAKVAVFGGGGYFNDDWPDMMYVKYLEFEMARHASTPVMLYGQTIGPFSDTTIARSLRAALENVDAIAYRDVQSQKTIAKAGVPPEKCGLTADEANLLPVFSWDRPASLRQSAPLVGVMVQALRAHLGPHGPSATGRIAQRSAYISTISAALAKYKQNHPNAAFIFIPSTTWDEEICKEAYQALKSKIQDDVHFLLPRNSHDFIGACQHVDLMISTNMHPIILAATNARPSIALSYHYKLDDYMDSLGISKFRLRIDDFSEDDLMNLMEEATGARVSLSESIRNHHAAVKKNAEKNWKLLASLYSASE